MRFVVCAAGGVATLLNVAKPLSANKNVSTEIKITRKIIVKVLKHPQRFLEKSILRRTK